MRLRQALLGFSLAVFAATAAAQDRPPYGPEITLEQAKKIAAGANAESRKNGWRMAIAIVDNHGFLVYYERMDDTQTASVLIASLPSWPCRAPSAGSRSACRPCAPSRRGGRGCP